jgi:hypothetical protein
MEILLLDDPHFEEEMSGFLSNEPTNGICKKYFEAELLKQTLDFYQKYVILPTGNESLTECYQQVRFSYSRSNYVLQFILIVGIKIS